MNQAFLGLHLIHRDLLKVLVLSVSIHIALSNYGWAFQGIAYNILGSVKLFLNFWSSNCPYDIRLWTVQNRGCVLQSIVSMTLDLIVSSDTLLLDSLFIFVINLVGNLLGLILDFFNSLF